MVCLHGYRYPVHEARIGELARAAGFTQVSESAATSPLMKLVSRGDTTVVDAYLSPILARYVDQVAAELPGVRVLFMQSNGGLADARRFRGKDSILSGPAGGIVGMARSSAAAGYRRVIGFDMGGTSTDVSHFAGEFERQYETEVAGVRMRAPMLSIHTVAAGGGSVLHFDGSRFRVGPDSAGASPGPACYRHGGPLTVTDANLMLGRIQPGYFPRVFGPRGDEPLDADVTAQRFAGLASEISAADGQPRSSAEVAAGFLEIAVANMANAIKKISVQRGYDITRYVLATFGGAGGQHACAVADQLGMTTVLIHPLAGVLSAYGMGLADVTAMRESAVEAELSEEALAAAGDLVHRLESAARDELAGDGVRQDDLRSARRAHLRYAGTDTALMVPLTDRPGLVRAFETAYRQQFSFLMPDKPVVLEAVSVELTAAPGPAAASLVAAPGTGPGAARVPMFTGGRWTEVDLVPRRGLRPGTELAGPAIITEDFATTVVEPGWQAELTGQGDLLLTRAGPARPGAPPAPAPTRCCWKSSTTCSCRWPSRWACGCAAPRTRSTSRSGWTSPAPCSTAPASSSPTRRTCRCTWARWARASRWSSPAMPARSSRGDVFILNDPYHGGTHLPDITVVTPVFGDGPGRGDLFFVASRGHHAEIGGITPGSMPAFSQRVEEEGVLIDNWLLVSGGQLREAATLDLLGSAEYPSRDPAANLADLRAQVAANEKGVAELRGWSATSAWTW